MCISFDSEEKALEESLKFRNLEYKFLKDELNEKDYVCFLVKGIEVDASLGKFIAMKVMNMTPQQLMDAEYYKEDIDGEKAVSEICSDINVK